MKGNAKARLSILFAALGLLAAPAALAHEAYVLTAKKFQEGLGVVSKAPFAPLFDATHWKLFLVITACVAAAYALSFLFATTRAAAAADAVIRKAKLVGPLIIRLSISSAFIFAARSHVFLGPELPVADLPLGNAAQYLTFLAGLMILFGVFTEIAAGLGILLFIYASAFYGWYMLTYTNYLGELIVLLLFGARFISFDQLFFGAKDWVAALEKWKYLETPIVRLLYGFALIYAGYTIKFVHQGLTVDVYDQYHLDLFFHAAAAFIAAGAGLSEIAIGVMIMLGFAQRLTILISLVFITLSLVYFHELLWPHIMLYGISFSLLINSSDPFTLDRRIVPWLRGLLRRSVKTA